MDSPWRDETILRELYHDEGMNMHEMAERLGCDYKTVWRWMERHGVKRQTAWQDLDGPWKDVDTLRRLYVDQKLSTLEIADKFDCDKKTVLNWLGRFNIPTRSSTHDVDRGWRDEEYMRELYLERELNTTEIAELLDTRPGTVTKWLMRHGIELRSIAGENHYRYKGAPETRYYGANWRSQRRKALRRDQHRCQGCGTTAAELGHEPHVHHIDPFDFDAPAGPQNKLSNLISLCPTCHTTAEHELNNIHG